VHHAAELGYIELQSLVQQLVAACPLHVPARRGVVMDLQPVRPQIQHPLHRAVAASHHELVHYLLHQLQTPLGPAVGLAAAVALVRTVIVERIVQRLGQLQRLLHNHELGHLNYGRQYWWVLFGSLLPILFDA
jgi:hypothetical protein